MRTNPAVGAAHEMTVKTRNSLSTLLEQEGKAGETEALLKESVALLSAAEGPQHRRTAFAQMDLAQFLVRVGRMAEAEALVVAAVAAFESDPSTMHVAAKAQGYLDSTFAKGAGN